VFARWFFDPVILEGLGQTLLLTLLGTALSVIFGGCWRWRACPALAIEQPGVELYLVVSFAAADCGADYSYNFSYLYDTLTIGIPFTQLSWAHYETINVLGNFPRRWLA
jgi:polar amino acid transport system permease protein